MLGIQAPWTPLSLLFFDVNGEDLFLGSRQGSHMLVCSREVVGMCIVDVLLEVKKKQSTSRAGGGPPPWLVWLRWCARAGRLRDWFRPGLPPNHELAIV